MEWLHHGHSHTVKKDHYRVKDIVAHVQRTHGLMLEVGAETEVC